LICTDTWGGARGGSGGGGSDGGGIIILCAEVKVFNVRTIASWNVFKELNDCVERVQLDVLETRRNTSLIAFLVDHG
jgi:hypothetical protein